MQIGWFLSMFLVLETSWYKVQSSINTRLICFLFFFNLLSNCYSSMVDVVHRARLLSLLPNCFLLSAIVLYVPVYFLKKNIYFSNYLHLIIFYFLQPKVPVTNPVRQKRCREKLKEKLNTKEWKAK